jgi:uncharacterized protein YbaR (Trm112 family)
VVGLARDISDMSDDSQPPQPDRDSSAEPDPRLLEILVCPVCRGPLEYDRERQELISRSARLAYPIRDGIPIMLPDEARELADEEA